MIYQIIQCRNYCCFTCIIFSYNQRCIRSNIYLVTIILYTILLKIIVNIIIVLI